MKHIEHIGIAVKDLSLSVPLFEKLLNTKTYKTESIQSLKVAVAFLKTGETKIELIESLNSNSAIENFIKNKGEGLHHIAFEVDDINKEIKRLKDEGFIILNEIPEKGADNKLVCFLHPKTTNGILIELCETIK